MSNTLVTESGGSPLDSSDFFSTSFGSQPMPGMSSRYAAIKVGWRPRTGITVCLRASCRFYSSLIQNNLVKILLGVARARGTGVPVVGWLL